MINQATSRPESTLHNTFPKYFFSMSDDTVNLSSSNVICIKASVSWFMFAPRNGPFLHYLIASSQVSVRHGLLKGFDTVEVFGIVSSAVSLKLKVDKDTKI